ncbi:MAG: glycoside hydrolase family 99-like domain-containing protein [Treponemataceae bacterium]|nr:glycoside hydrolase family 99-like domain-containing protein [Treponemataceae bacterium]
MYKEDKIKPRVLAFYLPQYHRIPENDYWWGEGFTEWTNVIKAKPLFEGHRMPILPHSDIGFYDLSKEQVLVTQANMAKSYGIEGFCFYHYWFKGKLLLEKPLLNFLANKKIKINFCLCWANESWTRNWNGGTKDILQEQDYGNEDDWKKHFEWLLPFFKDSRYSRIENKPIFLIYRTGHVYCLNRMIKLWREEAKKQGIEDLYILGVLNYHKDSYEVKYLDLDGVVEFEPFYSLRNTNNMSTIRKIGENTIIYYPDIFNSNSAKKYHNNQIPGAFPMWDNTPRHLNGGATVFTGCDVDMFKKLLRYKLKCINSENQLFFINAWNEWGESCILEPDTVFGYERLEALKEVLEE